MARFKALYRRLGWLDRVFLAVLAAALVYNQAFPDSQGGVLLTFLAFVLAVVLAFKWLVVLLRKVIWRLRYRLWAVAGRKRASWSEMNASTCSRLMAGRARGRPPRTRNSANSRAASR